MKYLQKSLSLFLCIVLCLSFFPISAAYADEAPNEETEPVSVSDELDRSSEELEEEPEQAAPEAGTPPEGPEEQPEQSQSAPEASTSPEEQEVLQHEHSYTVVVTAPTCTERGYTTWTCACGDSYVHDYTEALNHPEIIDVPEVPATETEPGTTAGKKCALCGKILEGCEEIPALEEVVVIEEQPEDDSFSMEEKDDFLIVEEELASENFRHGSKGIANNGVYGVSIDIYNKPFTTYAEKPYGDAAWTKTGCAWFASARLSQLTGKDTPIWDGPSWYNSQYKKYGFTRGSVPREKALICWSGGPHVAVIEKIDGNIITFSEGGSEGGSTKFKTNDYCSIQQLTRTDLENRNSGFLGYVYLFDNPSSDISVSSYSPTDITYNNAKIEGEIYFSKDIQPTCWGIDLSTSKSEVENRKADIPLSKSKTISSDATSPISISVNMLNDAKSNPITQGNTVYYWRFWVQYKQDGSTKYAHTAIQPFTSATKLSFNANGGSGSMSNMSLTLNKQFTVPDSKFTRSGYTCKGWYAKRSDNTWHVKSVGWLTEAQISSGGYSKEVYSIGRTPTFDTGWTDNIAGVSFTFYAVWEKASTPTVAKSGTYNGHTYERYDSSITWKEAKAFCESKGGHLVTIADKNENTWIANTLLSGCAKNVYFIGATDEASEGTWKWVTGETFWTGGRNGSVKSGFYANWDKDYKEPTDNTGENYAAIMGKNVGSNKQVGDWIDIENGGGTDDYSKTYCGFICEYEPKTYTVSYNANGGSGAPGNQTKTYGQNLTLSTTKPTWGGHTFLGWAESASATSAQYQPGGNYTKDFAVTLYAVWRLNKLSLQYNANGGSIGTNEYDFSLGANSAILRSGNTTVSTWAYGTTYTGGLINNTTFNLYRQRYSFQGWCMKADGSTTVYDQNVDLTPETLYPDLKNGDGTITLYAIWSADNMIPELTDKGYSDVTAKTAVFNAILTFNPEIMPTMWGIDITTDPDNWASSDIPLTINRRVSENQTSPIAIRIDFARDVDESKNPLVGNTTYYYRFWAQYVLEGQTKSVHSQVNSFVTLAEYTISYNANGGSGAPANQTKTHGTALTLSSTKPSWSGHTFLGWAESATATSAQYQPGGNYTKDAAVTLYAVWKTNEYTISYNANGGSGAPANQTKTHGTALTLSSTKPSWSGHTFLGWAESASATSAQYQPGGNYTKDANATLYAVWTLNILTIKYNANGGTISSNTYAAAANGNIQTNSSDFSQDWKYGKTTKNGLSNASSFGLTKPGAAFIGWSLSKNGSTTVFVQDDATITGETIYPNLKDGSASVLLYAIWKADITDNYSFETTLNMADFTGIFVYIDLPEGADASQYTVEASGSSYRKSYTQAPVAVSSLPKGSGTRAGMYQFEALRAGSPEMTDEVTVILKKGNAVIKSESYSVYSVAQGMLANGGLTADQVNLVKGLLQYGYYGHTVFKNPLDYNPVIDGAPALVAIPSTYATKGDPTDFGKYVTRFTEKLNLDSAIGMNLYLTLANGYSMNDFTYQVLDKDGNAYNSFSVEDKGNQQVSVSIGGIKSPQMARNFKLVVTLKSDPTKTATWTRSVWTCAYEGSARTSGTGLSFLRALYQYGLYAQKQFPKVA